MQNNPNLKPDPNCSFLQCTLYFSFTPIHKFSLRIYDNVSTINNNHRRNLWENIVAQLCCAK